MDGHKQFAHVSEQLRRALHRFRENRDHERAVCEGQSGEEQPGYRSLGGREGVEAASQSLASAVRSVKHERVRRDVEAAAASSDRRAPVPDGNRPVPVASSAAASSARRGRGQAQQRGAPASLQRTAAGRPCWVVPRAGVPLSMFDSKFWTSVDPLSFPYGDGVHGISRDVSITYDEWVQYLLERQELQYRCDIPWWDREPASVPDCAPAARDARSRGNVCYRLGDWTGAAARYTEALAVDPDCAVLLSNRSAAHLAGGDAVHALADAEHCATVLPSWWKAHYRRGRALLQQSRIEEAVLALAVAHHLNPHGAETRLALVASLKDCYPSLQTLGPEKSASGQLSQHDVCVALRLTLEKVQESRSRATELLVRSLQEAIDSEETISWKEASRLGAALLRLDDRAAKALGFGAEGDVDATAPLDEARRRFYQASELARESLVPGATRAVSEAEARAWRVLVREAAVWRRTRVAVEELEEELTWLGDRPLQAEGSGSGVDGSSPSTDLTEGGKGPCVRGYVVQSSWDTPQGGQPRVEVFKDDRGIPCAVSVEGELIAEEGLAAGDEECVEDSTQEQRERPARRPARWRCNRDLITMMYCLWRRKRYIQSARLFADKERWKKTLQELGQVTAEELMETMEQCGRSASLVEVLQNEAVPARVKGALRTLSLCMNEVVGTNAHRAMLRHCSMGYRLLWGAPLVFTTPNVADTKHAMVKLLYEGEEVAAWRLLEEDDPDLGSKEEMLRRVAEDPFAQAVFSDLMIRLYLEHVVGVRVDSRTGFSDSVAARLATPGMFGLAQAFFGPVETQGRGGLHAHISVWMKHGLAGLDIDKLRHGKLTAKEMEDLEQKLRAWRSAVLEAVSTVQFDSVEEFARQLGLDADDLEPLPLSAARQGMGFVDGQVEKNDVRVLRAPLQSFRKSRDEDPASSKHCPWRDDPPQGPSRKREFAAVQAALPATSQPSREQPFYRRLPRYESCKVTRRARVVGVLDRKAEARLYAKIMAWDARRNFAKNHKHVCMPTCFPQKGASRSGDPVRLCRFGYYHVREVAQPPRRYPKRVARCRDPDCPRLRDDDVLWEVSVETGRLKCVRAHPWHCAASMAVTSDKTILRYHRKGKALCVPSEEEEGREHRHVVSRLADGTDLCSEYQLGKCKKPAREGRCSQGEHRCGSVLWPGEVPTVCGQRHPASSCCRRRRLVPLRASVRSAQGLGKPIPWRYGPDCSSSHPGAQVVFRCNVDVQNTERVHVLVDKRKARRWRRLPEEAEVPGGDVPADAGSQKGACKVSELPVARPGPESMGAVGEGVLCPAPGAEPDSHAPAEPPDCSGVCRADFLRARAFVSATRAEADFFSRLRRKRDARLRHRPAAEVAENRSASGTVPVSDPPLPCASDILRSYLAQRSLLGDAAEDAGIRASLAADTGLSRDEVLRALLQSVEDGVHVSGVLAKQLRDTWTECQTQVAEGDATVDAAQGDFPGLLGTGAGDASMENAREVKRLAIVEHHRRPVPFCRLPAATSLVTKGSCRRLPSLVACSRTLQTSMVIAARHRPATCFVLRLPAVLFRFFRHRRRRCLVRLTRWLRRLLGVLATRL